MLLLKGSYESGICGFRKMFYKYISKPYDAVQEESGSTFENFILNFHTYHLKYLFQALF